MSRDTLDFTTSLAVDSRMAWYDIVGSIAHARMLGRKRILPQGDVDVIQTGLRELLDALEDGELVLNDGLEDVHSNIEAALTGRIGEAGGRLHTARSRNDQVATDFRMYVRELLLEICSYLIELQKALLAQAKTNLDTVLPGFTHTQHAQPVTLAHHLLAHAHRFGRDVERLIESYARINICPLGSAALAGTTYDIDREYVAKALGFEAPCENSMDGVSDRDFAAEMCFDCALAMVHLSSLCEEIVLWSSPEFGFVEVDDKYSTGSSIMPQKKNPDVAELVRARSAGAVADAASMLTLLRSLPLTYNRDLQEDKGIVFHSADTLASCLDITVRMVATLSFDAAKMLAATRKGYLNATELADYLVSKGMPFRVAHEVTGQIVRHAIGRGKGIEELGLKELRRFSKLIQEDVYPALTVESCISRRDSYGGTSKKAVRLQMTNLKRHIGEQERRVANMRTSLHQAFDALLSS
ncbi:MAG: argininosuccinate lyase [Methanomassiliicoccales archaeon]|jgi:argininosuccinate lyase|nr:argininosuccinate lyase [Methanomassiliicoccales archaeon]MDD1755217.1 argininosuccinate lyase [Methanomassiliicoccales archaeon]